MLALFAATTASKVKLVSFGKEIYAVFDIKRLVVLSISFLHTLMLLGRVAAWVIVFLDKLEVPFAG